MVLLRIQEEDFQRKLSRDKNFLCFRVCVTSQARPEVPSLAADARVELQLPYKLFSGTAEELIAKLW